MSFTDQEIQQWADDYQDKSPQEVLELAFEIINEDIAISFSGAEDVVLVDMASKLGKDVGVFTLDTGRLHPETYRLLDQVREKYDVEIEAMYPNADQVEKLIKEKGYFSFYQDDHKECCSIRKIGPLRRKLGNLNSWVTGQRKDQSPGTRTEVPVIQIDKAFSGEGRQLIKFNPLANWSSQQVWSYIRSNDVPFNALHEKGFTSIGCEPCTRPVLPGQHEREGRWWWEEATAKECGLHSVANAK
ncbi:MAG: phosphoadenylyl-sulfate reductase [Gammaproteobacteria bacterium]|nr:MAG: phosphoadenylyl-sulfate reductase [Gammaproteobacteria bacterium]PCJ18820.1 MAG: phosphoadenylyl-sulfate reductase [Gammaproteobacteria bacterium]